MEGPTQGPAPKEPMVGAVQVKSVDCNFALPPDKMFDGCPFSAVPQWLQDMIAAGGVTPHNRGSTDYAKWYVVTEKQGTKEAAPGDWIVYHEKHGLDVCPYNIAKIVRAA